MPDDVDTIRQCVDRASEAPPALRLMRCWRVMLAMTRDEAKNKAHYEYNRIQAVSRLQCRQRTAVRHDRASDHESEHSTDGATGQNEVNQFR